MSSRYPDTVYARRNGAAGYPAIEASGYASNEERLVGEALQIADVPSDVLRTIRPHVAAVPLFPPRFGYRTEPIGIQDVFDADRAFPDRRADFSGVGGAYSGSSTPTNQWW